MKFTFKHSALSLALAGSFALSGCNFIGDGDPVFTEPDTETPVEIAFGGTVVKGLLAKATVQAYLRSDTARTNDLLANTDIQTDENGQYDFTLTSNYGDEILVVVVADEDSYMICDAPSGCGSTAFGDEVQASDLSGITLSTIATVPQSGSMTAQVNTLTNLVSEVMALSSNVTKAQAQKIVLDLIGLSEEEQEGLDIFNLELVDGTQLANANGVAKKLSAFNAALSKVDTNAGGTTIKAKLDNLVNASKAVAASNQTNISELQTLLDEVATYVKEAQDEAAELDDSLTFEDPEIELEDGGSLTSTGTGTGSGTTQG